jgi:hypothetical protein
MQLQEAERDMVLNGVKLFYNQGAETTSSKLAVPELCEQKKSGCFNQRY